MVCPAPALPVVSRLPPRTRLRQVPLGLVTDPDQAKPRRHDRRPTERQRDERVKLEVDPDDALRHLLGVPVAVVKDEKKTPEKSA